MRMEREVLTEAPLSIRSDLTAIDMHVHLRDAKTLEFRQASVDSIAKFFKVENEVVPADELADMYRERKMMAVIVNTTDTIRTGRPSCPNDHIAEVVRDHSDVFLGMGVVEPALGKVAENEARRCKEELGLIGIGELNPGRQGFAPNDPRLLGFWRTLEELDLITLFHGGYAASGSNTPGGMGVKLRYNQPILIDDVAADCPDLRIICAHPSWPWQAEALAMVQHKANVYLDLSGYAPKYFTPELVTYVGKRIPGKVLFGTDWPVLSIDRWVGEFQALGLPPEVEHRVMLDNARKLLRVDGD